MARTRTFLAVDIGDAIRGKTQAVQAELAATGANVKWVDAKNYHITLVFLGELDDRDLATVCRLVTKAAAKSEPFRATVTGLGAYPNLRRPKVLWAGISEGSAELIELFTALETPLAEAGFYRPEERAYAPHLTLGRVNAGEESIAPELAKYADWTAGTTSVEEVLIMASDFRRGSKGGPEYTAIGRAKFAD